MRTLRSYVDGYMIVVQEKRKLVLESLTHSQIEALSTALPHSKVSGDIAVVPHSNDETRVLRNLGFPAPAPILYYYDWKGRYKPFNHQKQTAAFLTMHKKCLVLNEIGTGKTQSALWAADYLIECGLVKRTLIMSPLSTLERVWGDALYTSFPNRKFKVLHGTAEKRRRLLAEDADFYIINHDGFEIISEESKGKFDLIILDEAAVMRNPSTARYKCLRRYMDACTNTRLWMMTGTPTPNEPTDAWALAKLVGSPTLASTYTGFRDKVMLKSGPYRYYPRPNSPAIVADILQPSIRFSRDECLDLPDTMYQSRNVPLTKMQQKFYKDMVKHLLVQVREGTVTAANEAVKVMKLVQIASGVVYDEDGAHIELDAGPRIQCVLDIIDEVNNKVVVFAPLKGSLRVLEREIGKYHTVAVVNGDVTARDRNEIFRRFQDTPDPQVLLAHPACMAHGLTLTASSDIVWFAPITSNEQYTQANGRIERIGKTRSSNVIHIEATDLERKIFGRLKGKQKMQGVLLDILGEAV